MTYEEILTYIGGLPPFIPRKVARGDLLFNLDTVTELLHRLGDPQDDLRCIHVAGTNGKGSVAAFIASVLKEGGLKTGLYTSPYLSCIREQIVTDGVEISEVFFAEVMTEIIRVSEEMKSDGLQVPSEFEMVTAAAFSAFYRSGCDVCVVEVGLGGEWDATNVIKKPLLSVITNIGFDHTAVLGETLSQIASVKAGIIKNGCDVLVADQDGEVINVLKKKAAERKAELYICEEPVNVAASVNGISFSPGIVYSESDNNAVKLYCNNSSVDDLTGSVEGSDTDDIFRTETKATDDPVYQLGTGGVFQALNASLAIAAVNIINNKPGFEKVIIDTECIQKGLQKVKRPARFEVLSEDPIIIADGCHNEAGVIMLEKSLKALYGDKNIIFISGVLADKDFGKMCQPLIHRMKCVYTVTPDNPRALPAPELAKIFSIYGVESHACESVSEAVDKALENAEKNDVICAFGSLYYMGIFRKYILDVM